MNSEKIKIVNYLVSILVLSFIWVGSISAQETVNEDSAVPAQPQSQEEKKQPAKSKAKEKIFKPSEEISEDLPVPFPVDI